MIYLIAALYIAPAIMYAIYFTQFILDIKKELRRLYPDNPCRVGSLGDYIFSIFQFLCPVANILGAISMIVYADEMKQDILREYALINELMNELEEIYSEEQKGEM